MDAFTNPHVEEIKVIDPACGSGAFPMGMLHLLLDVYDRLDATFDPYKKKIEIIKDNLFGVDIEPMAVEICRLRVWLSIIVDEESDSKKIEPLPNLDFKFICANSLIPLKGESDKGLFDMVKKDELIEIRDKYFNARTIKSKDNLRKKFEKKIDYKGPGNMFSSDREKQLRTYHPFDSENVAQFFNAEFMFGVQGGFDIAIGNPPYVSVKGISLSDKKLYSSIFETGKGRFNLFTLFLERASEFLNDSGFLSFIIPDGIYTHTEYRHIRKYLVEKMRFSEFVLFSKQVFDAAVDTTIVFLTRSPKERKVKIVKDLNKELGQIDQEDFNSGPEYLIAIHTGKEEKKILDKIKKQTKRLDDFMEIQQGIIYSGQPKEKVFSNTPKNSTYKKILDGRDVVRFGINWDNKAENKYLSYTNKLHRPREERLFVCDEKLLLPRKSKKLICAYDDEQYYALNTAYVCVKKDDDVNLKYLVALINSKLLDYFYTKIYVGWQITIPALDSLPLPEVGSKEKKIQNEIISIVNKILAEKKKDITADTKQLEESIDRLVFELYGLTDEEQKIIEGESAK